MTPPPRCLFRDALDDKVNRVFAGKVVRKDLVRKVKVGANVPVFVLEFLLGKYCASSDEMAIQMGLQVVNDTLANNYIRPDESMKAQSKVKEKGKLHLHRQGEGPPGRFRLLGRGHQLRRQVLHIPTQYVRDLRAPADGRRLGADRHALRVRRGGARARTRSGSTSSRRSRSRRSTSTSTGAPSASSRPTSGSTCSSAAWATSRRRWTRRLKLLFLVRLIPLAERNYNLVELGPRGTGKSYVVQEISPYAALLTGPTTVANLFGHMSGNRRGWCRSGTSLASTRSPTSRRCRRRSSRR